MNGAFQVFKRGTGALHERSRCLERVLAILSKKGAPKIVKVKILEGEIGHTINDWAFLSGLGFKSEEIEQSIMRPVEGKEKAVYHEEH